MILKSNYYLISYDISNNQQRLKISKKLLQLGAERLQYSVFIALFKPALVEEFKTFITQSIGVKKTDKIMILPLHKTQMKMVDLYGDESDLVLIDELSAHTLIL